MGRTTGWHNIAGSPILVAENVVEYRHAAAQHVGPDDTALEVGCAEGCTTAIIARHARQAFGIDKSASQVAKAAARHARVPNLAFAQIEAWDLHSVLRLAAARRATEDAAASEQHRQQQPKKGGKEPQQQPHQAAAEQQRQQRRQPQGGPFTVVFIDVSGSRPVGDVDNLVMKYEQVFQPRLFVVKSYQLKRLVNRCHLYFCPASLRQQPALAAAQAEEAAAGAPRAAAGERRLGVAAGGAESPEAEGGDEQQQQEQQEQRRQQQEEVQQQEPEL